MKLECTDRKFISEEEQLQTVSLPHICQEQNVRRAILRELSLIYPPLTNDE
jgi:hypothetical protein